MKPKLRWKHSKNRVIGKVCDGIVEPTDPKFIKQLMKEKKKMKKTTSDNTNTTAADKPKLSPPWITYYREVEALFKNDPNVRVEFNEGAMEVMIFVNGSIKAMAIERLMTQRVTFGNVELKISVFPANLQSADDDLELIKIAFDGNDALKYTKTVETLLGTHRYAVFKKDIAQFYNDNMTDLHGVTSMLYANIALDVLPPMGDVLITTDSDDFVESMVDSKAEN